MPIGFGIVGCGMIANFHAKAIDAIPGAKLVACQSRRLASAKKLAAEHDCEPYDDLKAMLANPKVDVITICTPSGAHM